MLSYFFSLRFQNGLFLYGRMHIQVKYPYHNVVVEGTNLEGVGLNMYYGYGYDGGCGYPAYPAGCGVGFGYGGFALIVVLFILLIIIGATCWRF